MDHRRLFPDEPEQMERLHFDRYLYSLTNGQRIHLLNRVKRCTAERGQQGKAA